MGEERSTMRDVSIQQTKNAYTLLLLILVGYLVVAALFAIYTPAWQSPDEPAHYNYVAQVAANGCCPVIEMGDWNLAYQSELTSRRFAPELLGELNTLQYEDHQPPLYYLLASPVFKLTNGSLIGLRLFSVFIGVGVVLCAYGVGRAMYPERPWIAAGAAALVAFLPQHVAMMASVNNDGLAEVVIGVTLLASIIYLKRDSGAQRALSQAPSVLGVIVGIGFLTKASTYFLAGIVPLAILLKWWAGHKDVGAVEARRRVPLLLTHLAFFFIPALLLGASWWARNLTVYGWPDFLGLARHDLVVADQLRTAARIADIGWSAYLREAFRSTFNSFWGQFGWMAAPMPEWVYRIFQLLLLVVVGGWVLHVIAARRESAPTPLAHGEGEKAAQRNAWTVLVVAAALAALAFLYYNTEFVQYQGRYLFPGLIPFALWMALGLEMAFERGRKGKPAVHPCVQWSVAGVFLSLAALDVYLLWRVIVPGLSP